MPITTTYSNCSCCGAGTGTGTETGTGTGTGTAEPCVACCNRCQSPRAWDMVIGSTSTGCPACEVGTVRLECSGNCAWSWGGSYPQAATIQYNSGTNQWDISLDLSVCLDCDPCENTDSPGSTICYTTFSWSIDDTDWNCCDANVLVVADGNPYANCVLPCTFPTTITLQPIGECCGDTIVTECGTFDTSLEVNMAFYSFTGEARGDSFAFNIEYENRGGDYPHYWTGCYMCGGDEICIDFHSTEQFFAFPPPGYYECRLEWKIYINGVSPVDYWRTFTVIEVGPDPLYLSINDELTGSGNDEFDICGFDDIVRVGFNITELA